MYYAKHIDPTLRGNLQIAINQFMVMTHRTTPPKSIMVNRVNADKVKELLAELNLTIPVTTTGGCFRSELWLEA
jgi:hypothetical protein